MFKVKFSRGDAVTDNAGLCYTVTATHYHEAVLYALNESPGDDVLYLFARDEQGMWRNRVNPRRYLTEVEIKEDDYA